MLKFITNNFQSRPVISLTSLAILVIILGLIITRATAVASRGQADFNDLDLSKALMVSTVIAKQVDHYTTIQKISGQIIAARESDHGFDRSGVLDQIYVDEGDRVKKGDLLAKLDMRKLNARAQELTAELEGAKASENEASANLTRAQADFDRYQVLKQSGHISQHKFDQVTYDLAAIKARLIAAKSSIKRSRAALNSLDTDRQMSTLRARFDGSVVTRYLDEGASFGQGGKAIIRLIEDSKLEIHVGLPETAIATLKTGEIYQFSQMGKNIETTLRSVISKVDLNTRTVTAIFDVKSTDNIIAGSLAQLSINVDVMGKGFWLPTDALGESRRGLWSAYSLSAIEGQNNISQLKRQELQVIYTEANRVFVRGTLTDGDQVVASGIHRLAPGILVTSN